VRRRIKRLTLQGEQQQQQQSVRRPYSTVATATGTDVLCKKR
jgi:hypothetical protein